MGKASIGLIRSMYDIVQSIQPVTGRGVGYKLFNRQLIASMKRGDMQRVYRLLKLAREEGTIPWEWIVDETRYLEKSPTWDDPADYMSTIERGYRREFWNQQPLRCMVASEKGTVRGVLAPVLDKYGVGFQVMHGFTSATTAHDLAMDYDGRKLVIIYVGDYDPSGMHMSVVDLPGCIKEYGGNHVEVRRIAVTLDQAQERQLISFPAADKIKDPRYKWFTSYSYSQRDSRVGRRRSYTFGTQCWELDAMDPNDLRECVESEIKKLIEPVAWERCERVNKAEKESLGEFFKRWKEPGPGPDPEPDWFGNGPYYDD
jgi:hypothetical protein